MRRPIWTGRTTYIRGAKLLYPYDLQADPDDIIAHELAHIRLQTESEARANDLARAWREGETGAAIRLGKGFFAPACRTAIGDFLHWIVQKSVDDNGI